MNRKCLDGSHSCPSTDAHLHSSPALPPAPGLDPFFATSMPMNLIQFTISSFLNTSYTFKIFCFFLLPFPALSPHRSQSDLKKKRKKKKTKPDHVSFLQNCPVILTVMRFTCMTRPALSWKSQPDPPLQNSPTSSG